MVEWPYLVMRGKAQPWLSAVDSPTEVRNELSRHEFAAPRPDPLNSLVFKNQRGRCFGGAAVIVGSGRNARSHIHATAGVHEVTVETTDRIDAERHAREFEVDQVLVNRGRI